MVVRTVADGGGWKERSAPVLAFLQARAQGVSWSDLDAWRTKTGMAGETLGQCLAWLELEKQAHSEGDPVRWRFGPRPGAEP